MGRIFSSPSPPPPPPPPDTSYLDETRKQREEEKAKNAARLKAMRARSGGGFASLLEFRPDAQQPADKLGG